MDIVNIEVGTFCKMSNMLENLFLLAKESSACAYGLDEWLDKQDACLLLGVSLGTLTVWRRSGAIPYSRIERKVYYRRQDLIDFMEWKMQKQGQQP